MKMNKWHRNYVIRKFFYGPFLRFACLLMFLFSPFIPKSWHRLKKPIFIIGCSRSGTSIFIQLFKKHKELCNWSEAAQVFDLNYYDPKIEHQKGAENVTPFNRFRIQSLFGFKTRLMHKSRFINKHPQNSVRIEFLKEIFPDALFIHIIRDGRAVVESNYSRISLDRFRSYYPFGNFPKPKRWKEYLKLKSIEQFSYQWTDIVQEIRSAAKNRLNSKNYIEIRYEDFCQDPRGIVNLLDKWCSLDERGRSYKEIPEKLDNQNHKWDTKLSENEKSAMTSIIQSLNQQLGYN